MAAGLEQYRTHDVWATIPATSARAVQKVSDAKADRARRRVISILRIAEDSRTSPDGGYLYLDVLDNLQALLSELPGDEYGWRSWTSYGNLATLATTVRQLPPPPPKQLVGSYLDTIDEAVAVARSAVADLRDELDGVTKAVDARVKDMQGLSKRVDSAEARVAEAAGRISQVAEDAQGALQRDWETRRDQHLLDVKRQTEEDRVAASKELDLLANASLLGQRLVEQAAGRFTALDWTARATRERRSGLTLRIGSVPAFVAAAVTGGVILHNVVSVGTEIGFGGAVLRAAVFATLAAVGGFVAAESRRHYREADSAEEIAASLSTLESYFAGDTDGAARDAARKAVADIVFVKNVQSRLSNRDASRHGSVNNQQVTEILDSLSKAANIQRSTTQ